MTASEFAQRFPEFAYVAPLIETYCQGEPGTILGRFHAADAAEGLRLNQVSMRLLADGASDLERLCACMYGLLAEDRIFTERLDELVRALMPIHGRA